MLADVLLPLAVSGSYTYRIPPTLEARVAVGSRVVVPLGQRKFYTGIVVRLRTLPADEGTTLKDIVDAPDAAPSALPAQLALWQWIAQYYICTDGEVLK
ncbi:MAG: primosomal protein N', partial [Alloprevotella sp.]|nr:primosomal protein N' [Alloprevotella sp.]